MKRDVVMFHVFSKVVKSGYWYYTTRQLTRQPAWTDEENSDLLVYYRFSSLDGSEITPFDEFGSDKILAMPGRVRCRHCLMFMKKTTLI